MRFSVFLLIVICLLSCENNTKNAHPDYSENFYRTVTGNGIELRGDTLIIRTQENKEPVLIPTILTLNKEYVFISNNGLQLRLKRVNLTDIEYKIIDDTLLENGLASLRPLFYLGAETVGTGEGEFWITDYDIDNSEYLQTVGIGTQNLENETQSEVYAFVFPKRGSGNIRLIEAEGLWELKK